MTHDISSNGQPQTQPHNVVQNGTEFMGRDPGRGTILACRRKVSARKKPTKADMESANQTDVQLLASFIGERQVFEH